MCGHAAIRIPGVFGVFDHQTFVLGYLETANSSHQFSAAKIVQVLKVVLAVLITFTVP